MESKLFANVYDNMIPEPMLSGALDFIQGRGFQYGWKSDQSIPYGHWNLAISRTGFARNNRDGVEDELPPAIRAIWQALKPVAFKSAPVIIRAYANQHTFGTEGYVHTDSEFVDDVTAVIYLNRNWNINWAGETVLFNDKDDIAKAVIPKWGRVLVFSSCIRHAGRGVSRICNEARTVLVFKAKKN